MVDSESSRRRFVQCLGVAGTAVGFTGGVGSAVAIQDGAEQTFELLGLRSGWEGVSPDSIAGVQNPTLEFEAGTTYEIVFENGDGLTHNLVIVNDAGDVLERSKLISTEGESASIVFEATEEMTEYYCEPHSSAMRGEIAFGGQSGGTGEYQDIKDEYDFGFETSSDGFVGITPSEIEGDVNPEITMTEGEEYDVALVYGAERDDINLAFVDENGETIAATGYVNDHGTQSDVTVEATTDIAAYVAEDASDTFRGNVVVEEAAGPSREEKLQQLQEESDFVLDGITSGWVGIAPAEIEGTTNPTLELEAGQEYTIGWINGDGQPHNIAIWNDDDEALHSTETISTEGETQTLTFEASEEATQYVCEVHPTSMIGDLDVTGASTSTAAPTEEPTDGSTDEPTTSTDSPGFGGLTALAGVGAGVAAAARRLSTGDVDDEK